jgi:hypothetical protein
LEFVWDLGFGAWDFFGLGIWDFPGASCLEVAGKMTLFEKTPL